MVMLTDAVDVFLGIGSTAIKFGEKNRLILSSFGIACITALLASGYAADQTFPYCILDYFIIQSKKQTKKQIPTLKSFILTHT